MSPLQYSSGLKYQLDETVALQTPIRSPVPTGNHWVTLSTNGWLVIRKGYAWDGPSGPTLDTEDFMRASAVHDALYQLIREGLLSPGHRGAADALLRDLCIEDGMPKWRAWYTYWAVRLFGGKYCKPSC